MEEAAEGEEKKEGGGNNEATVLGLGVEGGFKLDSQKYDVVKEYALAVRRPCVQGLFVCGCPWTSHLSVCACVSNDGRQTTEHSPPTPSYLPTYPSTHTHTPPTQVLSAPGDVASLVEVPFPNLALPEFVSTAVQVNREGEGTTCNTRMHMKEGASISTNAFIPIPPKINIYTHAPGHHRPPGRRFAGGRGRVAGGGGAAACLQVRGGAPAAGQRRQDFRGPQHVAVRRVGAGGEPVAEPLDGLHRLRAAAARQ